jgi:hypothetical protein
MLKSESRRKHFAGHSGSTPTVDVTERTGLVEALVDEGVGEATRAVGVGEVLAGSRRGTSVKKSPVESTDGGLSSEPSVLDKRKGLSGPCVLTLTRQAVVACAGVPAWGENIRGHRACQ